MYLKCEYVEEQCQRCSYVMKYPLYVARARIDDNARLSKSCGTVATRYVCTRAKSVSGVRADLLS
jgi:hypothetical protein